MDIGTCMGFILSCSDQRETFIIIQYIFFFSFLPLEPFFVIPSPLERSRVHTDSGKSYSAKAFTRVTPYEPRRAI
jgi:hypothetical protein